MNPISPEQPITFTDGRTEFTVVLTDAGALRVQLTGRSNGKLLCLPEANTSVTLFSEKRLGIIADNR